MKPSIIQFGTSRFLQAHLDLFVHEAREADPTVGTIAVVAGSGSAERRRRLAALENPAGFPVIIRGLRDGVAVEDRVQVRSVVRGLDAERDWEALVAAVVDDADIVVSNTSEAGYAVPPDVSLDLGRPVAAAPPSYPARLLALLAARFRAGRPGVVVLPTELVGRNGATLQAVVTDLAGRSAAPPGLIEWVGSECIFANSLVDRIVSEAIEPAGAVAEPYALWAIEARPGLRLPCPHVAIRIVDDLEPVERLKIHILNLGHTVLAEHWMTSRGPGDMTVRALLDQPETAAMLDGLYEDEVLPGFRARGLGEAAERYVATTLERYRNPFLAHRLADIATNHPAKVDKRIGGFLSWSGVPAPRLSAIAARYGHLPA